MPHAEIHHGDCLQVLPTLAADSIDAIVTDPPYGLEFMGKDWDHGVPGEHFWREALRVAKPGAHMLAFGGTRTFHRLASAIEDAGWEIRDTIMWVYGSGFPKSLDISKAIDKAAGASRTVMGEGPYAARRPAVSSRVRLSLTTTTSGVGALEAMACGVPVVGYRYGAGHQLTAPATPEAEKWDGWGTALKPAHEMIVWATKPWDCTTIDASLSALEQELWSESFANGVELPSTSSPSVSDAGLFDGARWSADGSISTPDGSFEAMDTWPFALATALCWNTVRSWRLTLAALSEVMSTSTITTMSGLITDLKTLWFSVSQLTATNMLQCVTKTRGTTPPVSSVVACFEGVEDKLRAIRILSAPVTVTAPELPNYRDVPALRPNWRPIILARKKLATSNVASNVLRYGTGGINVDGCRVGTTKRVPGGISQQKPNAAVYGRYGIETGNEDGHNPNIGRWPANLIHDGSDEVLELFPQGKDGAVARFFYSAKASAADRDEGLADLPTRTGGELTDRTDGSDGLNSPRAGAGRGGGRKNSHPTVKPTALMRYLCRLITPPAGLVLDPFMGSGSTGKAAALEGFRFVGVELDASYMDIARRRIAHAGGEFPRSAVSLFDVLLADMALYRARLELPTARAVDAVPA